MLQVQNTISTHRWHWSIQNRNVESSKHLTINRPSCTQAFTVRTLNIWRKPRHRQKTNQCHLLVLFISIGLTRSAMLQCFLYTSCSSKDQNSEANRKRWERRPTDRICRLYRGTQRTWTPMPSRSTGKPHHLASKRTLEPPQHTRDPPLLWPLLLV